MDWYLAEVMALSPEIEKLKVGTEHEGHDGWRLNGDAPIVYCRCGEVLLDATGKG